VSGQPADWRALNRAQWDERTGIHLAEGSSYDLAPLRAGRGRLHAIEEAELGPVDGLRVLHLQCHFGADTLALAQRGATVVGLDFSSAAIEAARGLATELGLADRARFVLADLYEAPAALAEPASFDLVYVTWGTLCWLPDVAGWAKVVAHFLKPGGRLYHAEVHPAAWMLDDEVALPDGRPGWFVPYFHRAPIPLHDPRDYADPKARLANADKVEWLHPLSDILNGLIGAGLTLDWLHEHPSLPWQLFRVLERRGEGDWQWPDRPWLPLAVSLQATRRPAR
jgi:SAM-dependent methyltransferase